jgi:hypothetical protein
MEKERVMDRSNEPRQGEAAALSAAAGQRSLFTTVSRSQKLVHLPFAPGWIRVSRWNDTHEAKGFELIGADLSMPGGRPYGYLWYRRHSDLRDIRIGVRWDVDRELPECRYLDRKKGLPGKDREAADADRLELDALARITALMSLNAHIGTLVATPSMEDALLDAAGLGLPRVDREEPAPAPTRAPDPTGDDEDEKSAIIGHIRTGQGWVEVPRWDPAAVASEWTLTGWNVELRGGHPFGALFYRQSNTGEEFRVGVSWDTVEFALRFDPLHRTEPRLADSDPRHDEVLRDARSRVGAMQAIQTSIAQLVSSDQTLWEMCEAAGLPLDWTESGPPHGGGEDR